jgi:hypothetical protein
VKRDNVVDITTSMATADERTLREQPEFARLVDHLEAPTPPPFGARRENRIPRIPPPPPGGTVISLHAYRRHSALVAGLIVAAVAMAAAWWFR